MNTSTIARCAVAVSCAAILAGCGANGVNTVGTNPPTTAIPDAMPLQHTFHYTGREQIFRAPSGIRAITVVARGAAGAGYSGSSYGSYYEYFGLGGRVYAVIPVRSGETLYVFVGGQGSSKGGFNGGGSPGVDPSSGQGYGGGGASDVRQGGNAVGDRILVAAGGGGEGCCVRRARASAVTAEPRSAKRGQMPTMVRPAVAAARKLMEVVAARGATATEPATIRVSQERPALLVMAAREATVVTTATARRATVRAAAVVVAAAATTAVVVAVAVRAPIMAAPLASRAQAAAVDRHTSSGVPAERASGEAGKTRIPTA